MFQHLSFFALIAVAVAAPGFVSETYVAQPVVTKLAHTVPSAVSHQSFSQIHNKAHIVAPVVKTVVAPSVHTYHADPIVKAVATPVIHTYVDAASPVVKTIEPVYKSVHTYAAPAPAPIIKSAHSSPVVHAYAVPAPIVKTIEPVVPLVKSVHTYSAPVPAIKTVTSPFVHTYAAAAPVIKTFEPVVKTLANPVFNHAVSHQSHDIAHQSHVQIHQKAIVTPVVKSVVTASAVPVIHTIPVIKSSYVH